MRNRYGLKVGHWCNPTSTLNMLLSLPANRAPVVWQPQYNVLYQFNIFFWYVARHCASPNLLHRYPIVCLRIKIASMVLLLGMDTHYSFHEIPCILALGSDQFWVPDRIFCSRPPIWQCNSYHLVLVCKVAAWTFSPPWLTLQLMNASSTWTT